MIKGRKRVQIISLCEGQRRGTNTGVMDYDEACKMHL